MCCDHHPTCSGRRAGEGGSSPEAAQGPSLGPQDHTPLGESLKCFHFQTLREQAGMVLAASLSAFKYHLIPKPGGGAQDRASRTQSSPGTREALGTKGAKG